MSSPVYSEDNIQTLRDAEHVRLRPGMYIGSVDSRGLHQLLRELLANSLDEVKAGFGDHIGVMLFADGSCAVTDTGRGIATTHDPVVNTTVIEATLTRMGYSPKQCEQVYRTMIGLHYVGLKMVTALTEWGEVDTFWNGEHAHIEFERGVITRPLQRLGSANGRNGTVVRFKPDPEIFRDLTFDLRTVLHTLCELAFLYSGVRFTFTDERTGCTDTFQFADGLSAYVKHLNTGARVVHEPVRFDGKSGKAIVHVAFQYQTGVSLEMSYANGRHTRNGGTHVQGFRRGVREAVRRFAKENGCWPDEVDVKAEDIRYGITAVISIEHPDPRFESATWSSLSNAAVETAVARVVREGLFEYLVTRPEIGRQICEHIRLCAEVRAAKSHLWKARRRSG